MRKIFVALLLSFTLVHAKADEGFWLPVLLESLNQTEMQSMGLKLTADDIYSVNHTSLKDAVCLFGGGCTAEVVSEQGLIFTNYHCGFYAIQSHSTIDNNYLNNGFWAKDFKDELQNPALSVTFLVRMEDVTSKVLAGVLDTITETKRDALIKVNCEKIEKEAVKDTHYKAKVKPFYYGNEYYLLVYEVFNDIRLVGAPPMSIGSFGGDSDNWEWPRHTGDFCVFRIYADTNNTPADYSKNNVPYKPKKALTISLKGVKEGDFTMVYGYPGRTQEYITSYAVNLIGNVEDPLMYGIRDKKLSILREAMKEDSVVKLQYAAKYASVANFWKKMSGESKGLRKLDVVDKKKEQEEQFSKWVVADKSRQEKYSGIFPAFENVYTLYTPVATANDYFTEAGTGIDIIRYAWGYNNLISKCTDNTVKDGEVQKIIEQMKTAAKSFFKNYNQSTDKKVFTALISMYYKNADSKFQPEIFSMIKSKFNGDISKYADYIYSESSMVSNEKVQKMLSAFKRSKVKKLAADPLFLLASSLYSNYINNIMPFYIACNDKLDSLYRVYMKGLREMLPEKKFYPDANSTMRIAFGKVAGYKPMDAVNDFYFTTLAGVMQKENEEVSEYKVPEKLKELYKKKDYGRYSSDTTMHIAFIATNHTTGGNSGSPVLNGNGELIGINFDRVWQGTMSDIMFNTDLCRNISLDIRYALFIIDKFAGAKRLIEEMKIEE